MTASAVATVDTWLPEVQRLTEALAFRPAGSAPEKVGLEYLTIQPPSGKARTVWRASCSVVIVEADTAEVAMRALISELHTRLDKQIAEKMAELARLQAVRGRGRGLAVVPGGSP